MKRHTRTKRGLFIALTLLLAITHLFFACTKELTPEINNNLIDKLARENNNSGAVIFPVDLTDYNIIGAKTATKSSTPFTPPNIDSLLIKELTETISYGTNIKYTQIPLKKTVQNSSTALIDNLEDLKNKNKVSVYQSFYIIYENTKLSLKAEYIVTLLPRVDVLTAKMPNCTYLRKPNFSGAIIYSGTNGDFLRIDHYTKGKINSGTLIKPDDVKTSDTINYIVGYSVVSASTKSDEECSCNNCIVCTIQELNAITVVAYRVNKDDEKNNSYIEHLCSEAQKKPGGGTPPSISPGGERWKSWK